MEGRVEGTREERVEWLQELLRRRLGRDLSDSEQEGLRRRAAETASRDALFSAVLDSTSAQLMDWLSASS